MKQVIIAGKPFTHLDLVVFQTNQYGLLRTEVLPQEFAIPLHRRIFTATSPTQPSPPLPGYIGLIS